ncbi:hypothetical protein BgiMline_013496, partial [Biomphalaria glabrata]
RHGDSKFTSKGVWGVGVEIRAWHPVSTSLMAQVKKHLERNVKNRGECGEGKQFLLSGHRCLLQAGLLKRGSGRKVVSCHDSVL